jgi:AcrR family transcriptional regulator
VTADQRSVRDRILDTAAELFYREGARAVGVDLVVARSGVAKTSLYRHFRTKDDLIAAVLERDDAGYWRDWDEVGGRDHADPIAELLAHLAWIDQYTMRKGYRGCPFINVATEFPTPDHPARAVAARHKNELRRRLAELADRAGIAEAAGLADQLVLLVDGAYVDGHLLGRKGPARALVPAARALVAAASGPG